MTIIGALFFIFGFVTWLNGALIPFLQIVCELTESQALFVAFSFYIAYVVMALPMSFLLDKVGYKKAMSLGLVLIGLGCLLFIPAASTREFSLFLLAQFVMGSGLTILQTASNPYVVKIGPENTAAVRISIMGILNKFAGFLAPIVFTALVLKDFKGVNAQFMATLSEAARAEKIEALSNALIQPYVGMALVLFVLAILLHFSKLPELTMEGEEQIDATALLSESSGTAAAKTLWQYPHLLLGVVALFFYVGVEVIAGDTIGLYGSQLGVANATSLTSYTMAFMMIGYVMGLLLIPRVISQVQALSVSAILGLVLSIALIFADNQSTALASALWGWSGIAVVPNSVAILAVLGFANAMVWPAVWPLALAGLGQLTARGSALLIMGISGGAILPVVYGKLSEAFTPQSAYWLLVPCYAFILFYALKGHQLKS
uniref:sugar MFS transporter n=1 Tax=Ningiella ruwaisensis TaxID=2364274 RepID=UPI001F4F2CE6|nr:sugar MFS transporter [Ningiella ruwaisensis]